MLEQLYLYSILLDFDTTLNIIVGHAQKCSCIQFLFLFHPVKHLHGTLERLQPKHSLETLALYESSLYYTFCSTTHELYILMIMFVAQGEEAVTVSKQYECMLFVIRAVAISPGYFPIYDRIYSLSLCLSHLSLSFTHSFYFFNICPDLRALSHYSYLDICHC